MPTVTLTMSNGHNLVSGISFRKVKQEELNGNSGRLYSSDGRLGRRHVNGINGAERSSSDSIKTSVESVEVIRRKLKRGKGGEKRNGCVYDIEPGYPYYNNNGPLKAFPLSNNTKSKTSLAQDTNYEMNTNNSSLPSSASELPSVNSSSSSIISTTTKSRPPLQRLNGHGHKHNLPPGLASNGSNDRVHIPEANPMLAPNSSCSVSSSEASNTGSPKSRLNASALQSVLHRSGSGQNGHQRDAISNNSVTFAESGLPPGIQELVRERFIPGAKGFFQHIANLPLLISTDAAILKRKSSISLGRKNRVTVPSNFQVVKPKPQQHATLKVDESTSMTRSRSSASEMFVQPDVLILKSCFNLVLSFMGDDKSLLQKHHRSFGNLMSSKRKYLGSAKRLWRKSSTDVRIASPKLSPNSSLKQTTSERPFSMFAQLPTDAVPSISSESPLKKVPTKPHSSDTNSKNCLPTTVANLTVLEKVHFLVNVGLKLEHLRDEIYCLVLKQLVNNPSSYSTALGWILLALIAGSFPPSTKILTYVEQFIHHHKHGWGIYCSERLQRTVVNGPRTNPPSSLEIISAKSKELILLPVICADQSIRTVTVDPATTSKEILESMAEKNRIGEAFGFCIIMQSGNKIINLGAGRFSVMDALSQVELYAGNKFNKTSCRLYYRRDIFSPRDLFASDEHMAAWLTFSQICGSVYTGEYYCKKAPDLCLLVAHQYCVRHGLDNIEERKVAAFCEQRIPREVYKSDKKNWYKMVTNTLKALARENANARNPIDVMAQAIRYAMQNMTSHFVRTYSIITFTMVGGSCTYTSGLSLTLSHEGVTVRQGDYLKVQKPHHSIDELGVVQLPVILMDVSSGDLKNVKLETKRSQLGSTLTITLHGGGSYEIESAHGQEIYAVLYRYIRDILTGANKESTA